ncbi:MAG: contractile injection system tape measure protein [Aulosira sp. DedQUE10]|nr:contractile injection system tape measure protein [Aulosira sp. DedQUE10]
MSEQRHIIGKTVLEIDTGNLADVWSLQEDISRLLQQQIAPKMERLFDQLVGNNQIVRLDRVVVEVGSVDRRFLADEFVNNVLVALEQTLRDRLANQLLASTDTEMITRDRIGADWEVLLYFLQFGRLPWWVPSGNWEAWFSQWTAVMQTETAWRLPLQELLATNQAARQRLIEQLPEPFPFQMILQIQPAWAIWSTLLTQARQLIQSLELSSSAVRHLDRQAWLLLLSEIAPNNAFISPLPAVNWSRQWLAELLQTWRLETPTAQQRLDRTAQQRLRSTIEALPIAERSLWLNALDQIINSTLISPTTLSVPELENLIRDRLGADWDWTTWYILLKQARSIMQLLNLNNDSCQQLERQAWLLLLAEIELDNTPGIPLPAPIWICNWLAQLIQNSPELREIPSQIASQHLRDIIGELPITEKYLWQKALNQVLNSTSVETNTRSLNRKQAQTSATNAISREEETAGLFVNQAGLVLLHPFLRNYFDAVGLLDGDSFQDESAQQKAIYLLHYLATRQTDAPEYELVLPKLLCGWLLNEPVNREIELPEAALIEAEHLLQTAINYWQALKSSSPDGLRQGFLQREGKLTRSSDGNWKLQVEQKSIDILLSRLPWGLSMVKLPWMEELLIVEWN